MLIEIDRVIIKSRIRKDFGDIEELADDIKQNGLINPPVINKEYELLAGERRLRACKLLGWKQIEVRMMDTRDSEHELNIEISENDVRKDFSKAERVDYMKRLLQIEEVKAKERQTLGLKSDEGSRADEETAKQFGIGKDTMRKEFAIADNKGLLDPKDFADWDEGKLSTNKAYQKVKAELESLKEIRDRQAVDKQNLRNRITELENREPQIKEVIREKQVVPPDYEEWKRKAQIAQNDFRSMQKAYEEMAEKWKTSEREKASIKEAWTKEKNDPQAQMKQSALFFCAGIANFIERYGGYIWLTEHINELPETEKKGFLSGINALDAWVRQIKNNMGEYANE